MTLQKSQYRRNIMENMEFWKGLPAYPAENPEIYVSSDDTVVMKVHDTTAEGWKAYCKTLEEAGFEKYAENTIGANLFATYINDELTVNTYYIDSNKVTRVVRESRGALPTLAKDNVYEEKVDTLLTGIKLETIVFAEGMSYFMRLCDGSFILFDGGVSDEGGIECGKMYDLLKKQSPDGKIVIAAWLFSHCHGDHIGLVSDFMKRYHDEVEIQAFVYNFPKDEEILASDSKYMLDDSNIRWNAFRNTRVQYYPDVPVIKPHTGNKLHIRNATFEIYGTLEDLYPETIATKGGMNASSVLYKMDVAGQKTMWLGDAAEITGDVAIEQFGDLVKSDLMQIAHHGYHGGTVRFYERIDPTYCLYPIPMCSYAGNAQAERNKWFMEVSENVKLVMATCFGTYTIKLPFSVPDGKYPRIPENMGEGWENPEYFE